MCGLFGLARRDGATSSRIRKGIPKALRDMGIAAMSRGAHSTGLARVRPSDRAVDLVKDTIPADRFFRTPMVRHYARTVRPATAWIGHTRYATHGTVVQGNAHPFLFRRPDRSLLVGAHNGVISNSRALNGMKYAVDSANLFDALAAANPIAWPEILGQVSGSFAIAVYADGALWLARNHGSPLVVTVDRTRGLLAWGSTAAIVHHGTRRLGSRPFETARDLEPGTLVRVDLTTFAMTTTRFAVTDPYAYVWDFADDDEEAEAMDLALLRRITTTPEPVRKVLKFCPDCGQYREGVEKHNGRSRCPVCRFHAATRSTERTV